MTLDPRSIKVTSTPVDVEPSRCQGDTCDLVTDGVRFIFQVINFLVIVQITDFLGVATNVINIMCFVKQGLQETSNIFLLGLAISDLLSLATLIWVNVCVNPLVYNSDIDFDAPLISHITAGIHHVAFTRVTCWLTALVSLERCLCIALPLQIKTLLPPQRVAIITMTVSILIYTGNIAPVYYTTRFAWLAHPRKPNSTWLAIVLTSDQFLVESYSFMINNCLLPFGAFVVISVSTIILVVKLKSQSKWRHLSTAPGTSGSIHTREKSISKLVIMISMMFIICYMPICIAFVAMSTVPEFSIVGNYKNLNSVIVSFSYILETINASFSMFIYYSVSSKYRNTLRSLFSSFRQRFCSIHVLFSE